MKKILVCVSDAQLFLLLRHIMATEGFDAIMVAGPGDVAPIASADVAAIVLDWSPDRTDTQAVLDHAAACVPKAAVVVFARHGHVAARVATARAGDRDAASPFPALPPCDLLLRHPFDPVALLGFLRRLRYEGLVEGEPVMSQQVMRFADLEMNISALTVHRSGREVPLTALQFRLLRRLMEEPTTVVDRERLIASCWPDNVEVEPRTVDIHIAHIRRALQSGDGDVIRTVRGYGYALRMPGS